VETGHRAGTAKETATCRTTCWPCPVNPAVLSEDGTERSVAEVDALIAEMQAAGVWVFAGGLHPSK